MRARYGRTFSSRRTVAVFGLVVAVVAGCGSPGPTPPASPGSAAPAPVTPSTSPTIVVARRVRARATPRLPSRRFSVDFETNGDEVNGWWWLRDAAGAQQASWGFPGVPAGDQVTLDFRLLASDAITGGAGVAARFWLSYGPIVEAGVSGAVAGGEAGAGHPAQHLTPGRSPRVRHQRVIQHCARRPAHGARGAWVRRRASGRMAQSCPGTWL